MTDREKVLHGLNSCGFFDGIPNICEVTECPYREHKVWCVHELAHDAGLLIRELLKAQEPRVMTLDELSEKTDVWFENLVYDTIEPALSSGSYDDGTVGLMTLADELFYVDEADYGVTWRCWTSCPDQATREATPWN